MPVFLDFISKEYYMSNSSIFSKFTNLYELSKTLRFELKPTPETKSLADVIKEDKEIDRLYREEMKPMFDEMHAKFIIASLRKVILDTKLLEALELNYKRLKILTKNRKGNDSEIKELQDINKKIEQELRNKVVESYNLVGAEWKKQYLDEKIKFDGYMLLTKECSLDILAQQKVEKMEIIKKFDRFFTYFSGFNQNRSNYYSSEAKETAISYRIINENLLRFFDNREIFFVSLEKMPELKEYENVFSLEKYQNYLTQEAIENFNKNVIGEINSKINLFHQHNKEVFKRLPVLNILYKQIGLGEKTFNIFQIKKGEEWQQLQNLFEDQNSTIKVFGHEVFLLEAIKENCNKFFDNFRFTFAEF